MYINIDGSNKDIKEYIDAEVSSILSGGGDFLS